MVTHENTDEARDAVESARPLVAIDGPAGCGKSTVARELARSLRGVFFSTGTVYRAATLLALEAGVDLAAVEGGPGVVGEILALLDTHRLELSECDHELHLLIDGAARDDELHSTRVSREIHWLADHGAIRERLLPIQRQVRVARFAAPGPLVVEGRDVGTVVFPDAPVKVFLTASLEERAGRRLAQLQRELGEEIDAERVRADVARRDRFDRKRAAAPLVAAEGARVVDTAGKTVAEVVEEITKGLPEGWSGVSGD